MKKSSANPAWDPLKGPLISWLETSFVANKDRTTTPSVENFSEIHYCSPFPANPSLQFDIEAKGDPEGERQTRRFPGAHPPKKQLLLYESPRTASKEAAGLHSIGEIKRERGRIVNSTTSLSYLWEATVVRRRAESRMPGPLRTEIGSRRYSGWKGPLTQRYPTDFYRVPSRNLVDARICSGWSDERARIAAPWHPADRGKIRDRNVLSIELGYSDGIHSRCLVIVTESRMQTLKSDE